MDQIPVKISALKTEASSSSGVNQNSQQPLESEITMTLAENAQYP